jgi:ATP-binding cassette subfamily G (WHITE) protein 2 (SNQ2)
MTDILGLTTIATLYQAGNGIFEQFDKVLVLDEGKQIYYGPREGAVPFMEELGFVCDPAANRADFLTGVTVPTERAVKEGYEHRFPRTADEIRTAYHRSAIKVRMLAESNYPKSSEVIQQTAEFKKMEARDKHKHLPKNATVTASFPTQVKVAVKRQFKILWGDKSTLIVKQASTVVQALIAGSLFVSSPSLMVGVEDAPSQRRQAAMLSTTRLSTERLST